MTLLEAVRMPGSGKMLNGIIAELTSTISKTGALFISNDSIIRSMHTKIHSPLCSRILMRVDYDIRGILNKRA